jgi:N-glycosylase/DNA lyase
MFAAQVYVDGRIADLESFSMKDAPRELQVYISKSPNVRTCHIRTI